MNLSECIKLAEEFFEEESEPKTCEPFMLGPKTFEAFRHLTEFAGLCVAYNMLLDGIKHQGTRPNHANNRK